MKVLILTFYYPPDLCAGSFRAAALVKALRAILGREDEIDILTTMPNRYKSFSAESKQTEQHENITIRRIKVPAHKSGFLDQAKSFFVYFLQALKYIKGKNYSVVFATSSRLFTAFLGTLIARSAKAPLYLDIRDIFVDTMKDVLPRYFTWVTKPVFLIVERWTINHADKVNLVSEGFANYFTKRYPCQTFSYYTNGVDREFLTAVPINKLILKKNLPIKVVCAGNIGEGQGLHLIIPELAKKMKGRVYFKIIGDGGRKEVLQKTLAIAGVDNVELIPPISRSLLVTEYQNADVLFLHLNNCEAFKKVLPSKIFEYAAMGKPIWAGLFGYSADFVNSEIGNAAVFCPCNAVSAEQVFDKLVLEDVQRIEFIKKYSRDNICRMMAQEIVAAAKN